MEVAPHPPLEQDIVGMTEPVFATSGDGDTARRHIAEARKLIEAIAAKPILGTAVEGSGSAKVAGSPAPRICKGRVVMGRLPTGCGGTPPKRRAV